MKPNFFVIGAPKCGTTALCHYLEQHPQIFVSTPKEPHYFASDFPEMMYVKTLDEYIRLFDQASNGCVAVGEGSVWDLYSDVAVKNIINFDDKAKIIVMLRNPVDLVYSMHSQHLITLDENEYDFTKAWDLQAERKKGNRLPPKCREPKLLQYGMFGKLGDQLERLYNIVPKEQVHVITFDQFSKDTQSCYEDVLKFLNVDSDNRNNFPRINENKSHKNKLISFFTQAPPKWLTRLVFFFKKILKIEELGVLKNIRRVNRSDKPREKLDPAFRNKLVRFFESDVKKLSNILDADLSHWK